MPHRAPVRLLDLSGPRSPHALLVLATFAALGMALPAQSQFRLADRGWPIDGMNTNSVVLGDVDADGDLDVVFGDSGGQVRLYGNEGFGRFVDRTGQLPSIWPLAEDLVLGDVDGDGDLDLVVGCSGQNVLFVNNGAGVFTDATSTNLPAAFENTRAVALGDIDGDGDLDLVCGNVYNGYYGLGGAQNRLYVNNGSGVFTEVTAAQMPALWDTTWDLALGDIDGDGDLDLVCANGYTRTGWYFPQLYWGEQNRLLLNDGSGTFVDATATTLPVDNDYTRAVALGDIDGDGDLDLVFGNTDSQFQSAQNRLLRNDAGVFTDITASHFPAVQDKTMALAFGDVDLDGDLDLVAGGDFWAGQNTRLFVNQGGGVFVDATARLPAPYHSTADLALGDLDGDGDPDLVEAAFSYGWVSSTDRLNTNLLRQIDAPQPYMIGQTWTLDAYLRHGQGGAADFALPVLSLGTASVAVPPFGTLGIDPSVAFVLPLIGIPQPAGMGSLQLPVPVVPGLVGAPLYAQALLLSSALPTQLSNVIADEYTPLPAPGINSLSTSIAAPGTPVTIHGWNFLSGIALTVGGVPTSIVAQTPTTIDFLMPATSGCDATVTVTNLGNQAASETMNRTPVIAATTSAIGPATGGANLTITGQYLLGATVTIHGVPMNITTQTETSIIGTTPPGAPGTGFLTVSNAVGCATSVPYTYDGTPVLGAVTPLVALPGTPVYVTGNNFLPGLSVTVGGTPAVVTLNTPTRVDFLMPAGNGCDATLALTNPGQVPATRIMNGTPFVTSVPIPSGPAAGGAVFAVVGTNLSSCTVTFNGVPMTNVTAVNHTNIVGYTPPGVVGPAVVVIRNLVGCQTTTTYTYW